MRVAARTNSVDGQILIGGSCLTRQIERVRLSMKPAAASRRSKEQEVLHYQWFADLGNTDAARAVGQMLSHGAQRDPEQALRYFRCMRPPTNPPTHLSHCPDTCAARLASVQQVHQPRDLDQPAKAQGRHHRSIPTS